MTLKCYRSALFWKKIYLRKHITRSIQGSTSSEQMKKATMKKQFLRYKLIADQKVGRANKSEVLNEELLEIEKHMEHVRTAYQSSYKKLQQCLHSQGHGGDVDKRLKRIPENHLGNCLSECGINLENSNELDEPLAKSLQIGGEVFSDLAKEEAMYEQFVEENVVIPFHTLVETEIPAMLKLRERLKRLVLDRDNATQNLNKAARQSTATGMNAQQAKAKYDALQDELDAASIRMEQCKDQLITEMFEFLSKETEHSQRMLDLHAKQLSYHRKCVDILERNEKKLVATQESARKRSAYGHPIEEHLIVTGREIASPIEACVLMIMEFGLREEFSLIIVNGGRVGGTAFTAPKYLKGIFRIAGSATKLRKCRAILDAGKLDLAILNAQDDIHAVAGAMKQFLRELPDPLLTFELHSQWVKASGMTDNDAKLQEIWGLIERLPPANKSNLRYLVKFLAMVASNQEYNKMTPSNLAVVMGPNILWSSKDDISTQMRESNLIVGIMESMIVYADWFFPEDIDFVVTPNATSYAGNNFNSDMAPTTTAAAPNTITSSNNVGSTNALVNATLQPLTSRPSSTPSPISHNRKSSAEGALAASGLPDGTGTYDRRNRKQKSKAPPPPGVANDMASKSRSKSMLASGVTTSSGEPERSGAPPVATRRASTRRPQAPPPQPPPPSTPLATSTTAEHPAAAPAATTTTARVKPPIAARRRQVTSAGSTASSSPDNAGGVAASEDRSSTSSVEPSYPPPPLPSNVDSSSMSSFGSDLNTNNSSSKISELQRKLRATGHGHIRMGSGDSSDGQMTQF